MKHLFRVVLVGALLAGCGEEQKPNEPTPEELDSHLAPQELPATGAGQTFFSTQPVGEISITTRPNRIHIWVKVEDYRSKRKAASFFIRSGGSYTVGVPSGTYQIKLASGTTWYGTQHLFGSQTNYTMADDTFPISSGDKWSIELIPQLHGNLREKTIDAKDF